MKPIKLTGVYKVDQIFKKSKARYADGIIEGDIMKTHPPIIFAF